MITGEMALAIFYWFLAGIIGLPIIAFIVRFCYEIITGKVK